MSMTKARQQRIKLQREGQLDPTMHRGQWQRKPHTQVVQNKKAIQRRTHCRKKGNRDGADFFGIYPFQRTYSSIAKKWNTEPATTNICHTAW